MYDECMFRHLYVSAENLVVQDVYKSKGSVSLSSTSYTEYFNSGTCLSSSSQGEEYLANTDARIVNTNHCMQLRQEVPFIFRG